MQGPTRLEDCFAMNDAPRTEHRLNSCEMYRSELYYMTIDCILQELRSRFGDCNQELMQVVQACSAKAEDLKALNPLLEIYSP